MDKYTEFTEGLQRKVFLNIFDYATNETDIYNLVDIVFSNTTTCNQTDLLFENSEFLFIWANALYLFNEAPTDEHNMFMMAELFSAGVTDSEESSDLDRLFEMLREKNPNCLTIKKYDDFKACSVGIRNAVIKSCMGRIAPICCVGDSVFGGMLSNFSTNSGITEYVDSFISNSQCQLREKICNETEYNLILSLLDYVYQQKVQEERTDKQLSKILVDVYTVFDLINQSNPTSSYCISFHKFCDSDKKEQKNAISNFKKRLNFWESV